MKKIQLGRDLQITQVGIEYQIAGLLFTGANGSFILQLPHKAGDIHDDLSVLELDEDGVKDLIRQLDIQETKILSSGPEGIMKSIVRKTQRQIDGTIQWKVFARDNYTCRYCNRTGLPMSVDHIDLWENGGVTIEDNLLTACKRCNRDRGSIEYKEWLSSPVYARLSKDLPQNIKNKNMTVALDLPRLEGLRVLHVRSR